MTANAASTFQCPECDQRQRAGTPGTVVACAGCGSPITVPTQRAPKPPAAPAKATASTGRAQVPWGRVVVTAAIAAALHITVYLALTSEARGEMAKIDATHSAAVRRAATPPDSAPAPGTAAYTAWRENEAAHQAAHTYERHAQHRDLVRNGVLLSFFAWTAMVAWVLTRVAGRAAAASRRTQRARG